MSSRAQNQHATTTTFTGGALVVLGAAMFLFLFFALYPVVRNPVGTYDRWFPVDETATSDAAVTPPGPQAAFSWQSTGAAEPPRVAVQFTDESEPIGGAITSWTWDFGDGAVGSGRSAEHEYPEAGTYLVRLTVRNADGATDSAQGRVTARDAASSFGDAGRITDLLEFDPSSGLNEAIGSIGASIGDPIGSVVDSVGDTAKGGVVVLLFGLAAIGAMMVAWRISRVGVMLLTGTAVVSRRLRRRETEPEELRLVE